MTKYAEANAEGGGPDPNRKPYPKNPPGENAWPSFVQVPANGLFLVLLYLNIKRHLHHSHAAR